MNLKKKWFIVLDSEKFLSEKAKKKVRNSIDYRKRISLNKEPQKTLIVDKKKLARKSLLQIKYNLKNSLKKLAWDNFSQRKILNEKLKEVKQKLELSKPVSKAKKKRIDKLKTILSFL